MWVSKIAEIESCIGRVSLQLTIAKRANSAWISSALSWKSVGFRGHLSGPPRNHCGPFHHFDLMNCPGVQPRNGRSAGFNSSGKWRQIADFVKCCISVTRFRTNTRQSSGFEIQNRSLSDFEVSQSQIVHEILRKIWMQNYVGSAPRPNLLRKSFMQNLPMDSH